jgi:hypothetical protein
MKTRIQKISLLILGIVASLVVNAQTIQVSAAVVGSPTTLANTANGGAPLDVTAFKDAVQSYFPITITIKNTGTSPLVLSATGGKYVSLSGTGASDYTIDESGITSPSIAAGSSETFSVAISSGATNGNGKVVTLNISSNDPVNGAYAGSIKYTFTNKGTATSITNASDIGLSLYPNPSSDGHMQVKANNVVVNRIVVSNIAGQTEEFTTSQFTTSLKGLLLVKLYTDKGVVSEKIIIQE